MYTSEEAGSFGSRTKNGCKSTIDVNDARPEATQNETAQFDFLVLHIAVQSET